MPCPPEVVGPDVSPAAEKPTWSAARAQASGETARTISLDGRTVAYTLRRASRRTIGLTIDHRGLRVGAPQRATMREVESLLRQHAGWITAKLEHWASHRPPAMLSIVDGLQLPLLGAPLTVRLALGANRCLWNLQAAAPTLTLYLRGPADGPRILEQALRERARALFTERLAHYAPVLGVEPPRLSLSSASRRWGSCSPRSGIRLNWRLIHFPLALTDYVVAHELAHLREMNHGPRFWALVDQVYPDHRAARQELRRQAVSCPRW